MKNSLVADYSDDEEVEVASTSIPEQPTETLASAAKEESTEQLRNVEDDDEEDLEDVGIEGSGIPMTKHVLTREKDERGHTRAISTIDIDSAGSRMITGSYDFTLKLWDFNSMESNNLTPFRSVTPWEGYNIIKAKFSITGNRILIASPSNSPKMYDREGSYITEYAKGDVYIKDRKHTDGHIMSVTGCDWHPVDGNRFITGSADGTVRIWDAPKYRKCLETIVCKSKLANVKAWVTTASYSNDHILAGNLDGSIRLFALNGPYVRPVLERTGAHAAQSEITKLAVSISGRHLASRSKDGTLKHLPALYSETGAIFSPDDLHVMTGTNEATTQGHGFEGGAKGSLVAFKVSTGEQVVNFTDLPGGVLDVLWDKRINQIFATLNTGNLSIHYDESLSRRGIVTAMSKEKKFKGAEAIASVDAPIYNPHSLPMFRQSANLANPTKLTKRQLIKQRKDPVKTKLPQLPLSGPGKGGRIAESFTLHVMQSLTKNTLRDEDPREALLKFAKEAEENPVFIGQAYKKTQPKPIFQDPSEYHEDEVEVKKRKKN